MPQQEFRRYFGGGRVLLSFVCRKSAVKIRKSPPHTLMSIVKDNPVKSLPFTKQLGFRKVLYERVDTYLKANNLPARDVPEMYLKTAIIAAWWLGAYLLILLGGFPPLVNLLLCMFFGFAVAGAGFNIMHDAIHGGYSNKAWVNKVMGFALELLGSSSFIWRQKHNVWHHTYTNVSGLDEDLETNGLMRFTPHDPWRPMFRFQHIYLPFVYSLTGFSFIIRDFRVFFTGKSDDHHMYPKFKLPDVIQFWVGKGLFFSLYFLIPMTVFPWWQVLIGFVVMIGTVGITLAFIFQLAHVMDGADYPEPTGDPLKIENEWAAHQIQTTVDFAPGNKVLNWYAGGLNFQVEHHLFPHICHVRYPVIAPIVQKTCEEFGIKYLAYPSWKDAVRSHFHMVRELGQSPRTQPALAASGK